MKKNILSLTLFFISLSIQAQQWTWMKGTDTLTRPGIYGTMGVASSSNNPGSRHAAATWVDNTGNLWLFGGEGVPTTTTVCWLSDLWKFDITTNQWTWIKGTNLPNQNGIYGTKGVPAPTNNPGAREFMVSWTDASGNFWMFGGDGFPATGTIGQLNDLWRYNPLTNQWTWMNGTNLIWQNGVHGTKGVSAPANTPGTRNSSGAWTDAIGNLWLFGGYGYPAIGGPGNLNDLWKYNVSNNEWAWMHGPNTVNQFGNYGTLSVASPTNNPGGREFPTCWKDKNGDLWLFGGGGFPEVSVGSQGHLNDLWKYKVSNNTWTWMGGTKNINQQGIYGTLNTPSTTNMPGSRFASAAWTDPAGNFWLFGGTGYASSVVPGRLNDMFKFNILTNEWTWEHGNSTNNSNGVYGIMNVMAPFTMPGARYYNTWWKQNNGNLWLFGGLGFCATGNSPNNMNDLWRFTPPCDPVNLSTSSEITICNGNSATLTAVSAVTPSISWYATSTSTTSLGTGSVFITPTLSAIGSQVSYTYYANASQCSNRTAITITVNPLPTVTIAPTSTVCSGTFNCLNAAGATTYTWAGPCGFTMLGQSPCFPFNIACSCTYTVFGEDANGCRNTSTICLNVNPSPNVTASTSSSLICTGQTATLTAGGAISYTWNPIGTSSVIVVSPTITSNYTVTGTGSNGCIASAYITQNVSACTGITTLFDNLTSHLILPNPNSGIFRINSISESELILYNSLGQEVSRVRLIAGENLIKTDLAVGIYYYQVFENSIKINSGKMILE